MRVSLSCRLVILDKNPGLRPIGVGEVLRRIAEKVVIAAVKDEVTTAVAKLQLCRGQDSAREVSIHSMQRQIRVKRD